MGDEKAGRCLCGAVAFRIEGGFERFYLCHCARCRRGSGSAHSANLFSASARLVWLAGADQVTTFELPETRHSRAFYTGCGAALPYALGSGGGIVVPAGALDGAVGLRPDAHICLSSRADWDQYLSALKGFDGLPE